MTSLRPFRNRSWIARVQWVACAENEKNRKKKSRKYLVNWIKEKRHVKKKRKEQKKKLTQWIVNWIEVERKKQKNLLTEPAECQYSTADKTRPTNCEGTRTCSQVFSVPVAGVLKPSKQRDWPSLWLVWRLSCLHPAPWLEEKGWGGVVEIVYTRICGELSGLLRV